MDRGGAAGSAVPGGGLGGSAAGGAPGRVDDVLNPVLWYRFDENSGTVVGDSSGYSTPPRNGAMVMTGSGAGATFSTVHRVGTHSLSLTGNGLLGGGYVTIPKVVDLAPQQATISVWVFPLSNAAWQRVFDFSSGLTAYAFLTIIENLDSARHVRFAITAAGNAAEEVIDSTEVLTLNSWHHLAVVLEPGQPYTGTLYVDGKISGTNPAMNLHLADLGVTTQNTLGKSAFNDAYLSARLDDFRIYRRALTGADVAALFAAP
jgi:Concanavalin A-like lectin/glucanases superfamily